MTANKDSVFETLSGQQLAIPDLRPIFKHWPESRNIHYDDLVQVVDRRLEELVDNKKELAKLKKADFALFASSWWPAAGFDELRIVAYLAIWLFLWDDELDDPTGRLSDDMENSQRYRLRTTQFVEQALGLADHNLVSEELHPFISSFEPIGQALERSYTLSQRRAFMAEMEIFMAASEFEQRIKLTDGVWTLDSYWKCRLGTSAVGVCSAIIEYTRGTRLPVTVVRSKAMQTVWYETNKIVSLVNDLLSVKKEFHAGSIDSLIPIAYASGTPLQTAVDQAVRDVQQSVDRFDKAASILLKEGVKRPSPVKSQARYELRRPTYASKWISNVRKDRSRSATSKEREAVATFLETSRQNCTGNLAWSLLSARYGMATCKRDEHGTIHVKF